MTEPKQPPERGGSRDRPSPHDKLFRHAFGQLQNATGLLRALLPSAVVAQVDWSTLALRAESHVDPALRALESDLVFSARAGHASVLFYVLVEHQSASDPMMAWRLWRYVTRVWERALRDEPAAKRLPRVIPVVVHHGLHPWSAARSIEALVETAPALDAEHEALLPHFTYILDDLTAQSPEALRARALPAFGALALWALQSAPRRAFAQTVGIFRDLFDVVANEDGAEAFATLLRYLSLVARDDEGEQVHEVLAQLSPPVQERAMSYYDRLINEGLTQGKLEGKLEGALEGRRSIVRKLLSLKFGALDAETNARLEQATADALDAMAERILTAGSVDEVLG